MLLAHQCTLMKKCRKLNTLRRTKAVAIKGSLRFLFCSTSYYQHLTWKYLFVFLVQRQKKEKNLIRGPEGYLICSERAVQLNGEKKITQ